MSAKEPTVRDVAKRAGVSPISVSRFCNPGSTFRISEEMGARITKAIQELNYRPNTVARSLRTRRVDIVAFYDTYGLLWLSDRFSSEIFIGLQLGCADRGQELLVVRPMPGADYHAACRALNRTKSDAIVCLPGGDNAAFIDELAKGAKKVVQIGEAFPSAGAVVADDFNGARLLARHLIERGHQKVLYLFDHDNHISAQRRLAGFKAEAEPVGMEISTTILGGGWGDVDPEIAELLARRRENGITAVACWHDFGAVRLLKHCVAAGIRIPEDIAVVGFDGLTYRETPPGLKITTFSAEWRTIARQAVNTAVDLVTGEKEPAEIFVPGKLIVGNTT